MLAIDIGNTHITLGLFDGARLIRTGRFATRRDATADELGILWSAFLRETRAAGACLASVVPQIDAAGIEACRRYLRLAPIVVGAPGTRLGIRNRYRRPEEVGADRLVNAVAVHFLYKGKAAIVVDFGTATTFDCVSAHGDYLGGVISPGLEVAAEALSVRTAKLPKIAFQAPPVSVLGRTTKESLQSGLFFGYIALIEGLLARLKREMGGAPAFICTGGLSSVIGPHIRGARIDPDLTLKGLQVIWRLNQTGGRA